MYLLGLEQRVVEHHVPAWTSQPYKVAYNLGRWALCASMDLKIINFVLNQKN